MDPLMTKVAYAGTELKSEIEQPTIEERIIHCLGIYPIISPSMLQMGIGSRFKPEDWKPVLRDMIDRGIVIEDEYKTQSVAGRYYEFGRLRLTTTSAPSS